MAEEAKVKLIEAEEVRQRIAELKKNSEDMAEYIKIGERRENLARLENLQAQGDFWNNQNKAREVIASTNAERAYTVPYDALLKTIEDAQVMFELAEMEEGEARQVAFSDTLLRHIYSLVGSQLALGKLNHRTLKLGIALVAEHSCKADYGRLRYAGLVAETACGHK